jgi:hypothetical protein
MREPSPSCNGRLISGPHHGARKADGATEPRRQGRWRSSRGWPRPRPAPATAARAATATPAAAAGGVGAGGGATAGAAATPRAPRGSEGSEAEQPLRGPLFRAARRCNPPAQTIKGTLAGPPATRNALRGAKRRATTLQPAAAFEGEVEHDRGQDHQREGEGVAQDPV